MADSRPRTYMALQQASRLLQHGAASQFARSEVEAEVRAELAAGATGAAGTAGAAAGTIELQVSRVGMGSGSSLALAVAGGLARSHRLGVSLVCEAADGGGTARRGRLVPLAEELASAAELFSSDSGMWWYATYTALLPGRALTGPGGISYGGGGGAAGGTRDHPLLLLKLYAKGAGSELLTGWAGLPLDGTVEGPLRLWSPPLPSTLADALWPRGTPLDAYLHCELALRDAGCAAAFAAERARQHAAADAVAAASAQILMSQRL